MNTDTRKKTLARLGAGAVAVAIGAALTLGAATAASAQGGAPIAAGNSYSVAADTALTVSGANGLFSNDSDPEGDPISISQLVLNEAPMAGESLVANNADGSFVYTPPTGYTGTRVYLYRVTDGTSESGAGVSIIFTITGPVAPPVNTPPVAVADGYAVTQDVVYSAPIPGLLVNDTDADGDALEIVGSIAPIGGMMPGEALSLDKDGSFHYVPPAGFTGVRTWTYNVTDGTDDSALADLVFTITASAPANSAPIANADTYAVIKNVPVAPAAPGLLANDTDADGDTLEVDSVTPPAGGLLLGEDLVSSLDGSFTYTPPTDFVGTRVFTYLAWDGSSFSAPANLTFTVSSAAAPANTAPVANNDSYAVAKNTLFSQAAPGIFANDTDADGDSFSVINANPPAGGLLPGELMMGNPNGSFDYTPPTDFVGDRVFTYRIFDGTAASAEATITFQVRPRVALDEPTIPTLPDGDPTPTGLASTGSTPWYGLGVLAVLLAGTGFVLVRNSRREA